MTQNSGRYQPENRMEMGEMVRLKITAWLYRAQLYALLAENNMRSGNDINKTRYYQMALLDCNQALASPLITVELKHLRPLLLKQRAILYAKLGEHDYAKADAREVLQSDLLDSMKTEMLKLLEQEELLELQQPIASLSISP